MKRLLFILLLSSGLFSQASYILDLHDNMNYLGFPVLPNSTEEVIESLYPYCELYTDTDPEDNSSCYDLSDCFDELITSDDILEYDKGYVAVCFEDPPDINIHGSVPDSDCIEYSLNSGWNFISFPLLPGGGYNSLLDIVGSYGDTLEAIFGEGLSAYNHPDLGWIGSLQYVLYGEGYYFKATEDLIMTICGDPYLVIEDGCTDISACNYNETAIYDNGSCYYPLSGCDDTTIECCPPDGFGHNPQTNQLSLGVDYAYKFNSDFNLDIYEDWIGGFKVVDETQDGECLTISEDCPDINLDGFLTENAEFCVGSYYWNGENGDSRIPLYGYAGSSPGYLEPGDQPYFKLFDSDTDNIYFMLAYKDGEEYQITYEGNAPIEFFEIDSLVAECPFYNNYDTDNDNIPDTCDACPNDAENDIDNDGICGNIDECPYDSENDIDNDGICDNDYEISDGQIFLNWSEADTLGGGIFSFPITATFWDTLDNPIADSTSVYWYISPEYIASIDPESKIGNCGAGEPGQTCINAYYTSLDMFSQGEICALVENEVSDNVVTCSDYYNPCVDCKIDIIPLSPTVTDYCQTDDADFDILIRASLTDPYGDPVTLGNLLMSVFDATAFNFISSEDTTIDEDMGYEFDPPIPASATQITDANGEVFWIVRLPSDNCQNTNPDDPDVFSCNNVYMRAYLLDPLNGESADLNAILFKNCQTTATLGDINNDGEVNIFDIIILINLVFDNEYTQSGDMNEDGELNIADCILLVNLILAN